MGASVSATDTRPRRAPGLAGWFSRRDRLCNATQIQPYTIRMDQESRGERVRGEPLVLADGREQFAQRQGVERRRRGSSGGRQL